MRNEIDQVVFMGVTDDEPPQYLFRSTKDLETTYILDRDEIETDFFFGQTSEGCFRLFLLDSGNKFRLEKVFVKESSARAYLFWRDS